MLEQIDLACSICGRDRANNRGWRACKECSDVRLDVEHGKLSAWSERWYCPSCVKVLESKRSLWFQRIPLCGHCGKEITS